MKYIKKFESNWPLASDSYNKRQERMQLLSEMSYELWDNNFNVQVSSEILSRDDKYIKVSIQKRAGGSGSNFKYGYFNYDDIKDVFLMMISYMEEEGLKIAFIDGLVSPHLFPTSTVLGIKEDNLYLLGNQETKVDTLKQLVIKFKE